MRVLWFIASNPFPDPINQNYSGNWISSLLNRVINNKHVEIGVAFNNRDTISVKLDALPVNGKIILVPLREKRDDNYDD